MRKKIKGAVERAMLCWDFVRILSPSIIRGLLTGKEVRTIVGKIGPKPEPNP
jgi:hypothetical protein